MKKEFGDQIKIAVLHLDEKTPHLHFMIGTELKSVKTTKNRYGATQKENWSLNAKRYDPDFLRGLHDRHAEHNKKFELKRGVKGSMRKHTSLKKFYNIVDKALSTDYEKAIEKTIQSLETGFLTGKVSIEDLREKFKPAINTMFKQNKVIQEKFALDIKGWAEKLAAKEIELTAKEDQLNLKQQSQNLKFTEIDKLRKEKTVLIKANEELALQNEELARQLPRPKGAANQPEFKRKA
jgi:Plasmid recombination enzyme